MTERIMRMKRKIDITKTETVEVKQTVELDSFWVLRGIKDTGTKKEVVAELRLDDIPTDEKIAQFLIDNPKADFCSAVHNFEIVR